MSAFAIRVENLGKLYRIGEHEPPTMLREHLAMATKAWFRRANGHATHNSQPPTRIADEHWFWALQDVSFEVPSGQVAGIIGRNGAGKSTLLKVLSRITSPTQGCAQMRGRVGSLLEVGTGFHPELTGRENIYLNGALLGMKKAEVGHKFDEIVAFAETERFLDTPVKYYSSGMYMRLAFAVAAHMETEILIVDEVLAVGDAQFQKKCLGKMEEAKGAGRTVLFVSHNMNAIEQLCDRVILLDHGRLQSDSNQLGPVLSEYLFGGGEDAGCVWDAHPSAHVENPWFHPYRLALVDEQGQPLRLPARWDQDVWVEITGEVRAAEARLFTGYWLYSEREAGNLLYASYSSDAPGQVGMLAPGRQRLRSRIPSGLLNEGCYRIELVAGLHDGQWLSIPGVNAPQVKLRLEGGLGPGQYLKRPGLLAPKLNWETTHLK